MSNLGVYIQVPFCASKCTFCNFSSGVERTSIFDSYTRMIQREIAESRQHFAGQGIPLAVLDQEVTSIYLGGGTPALLGAERLATLVDALRQHLRCGDEIEFTLETTPGSASSEMLGAFREIGINRLSIGAQTFDERELRVTGRLHTVAESSDLVRKARAAGFRNISLDLIAGLPYQTEESFRHSLEVTAALRPEHVSLYLFEVDDKSRLGREVVHGGDRYHAAAVPDDDFMAHAYEVGCEYLAGHGYAQYEISNFALPGFESSHNRKYWQLDPYMGLGAGAHSFDGARRWSNQIEVRGYIAKLEAGQSPIAEVKTLSADERVEEFLFLGLRQVDGVDLAQAKARWGADCMKPWEAKVESLRRDGWIDARDGKVFLTRNAYLVSNEIFQEFVSV